MALAMVANSALRPSSGSKYCKKGSKGCIISHIKLSESTIVSVYRHASRVIKYHLKYQKKNTSYMFIVSVIDFRLCLSCIFVLIMKKLCNMHASIQLLSMFHIT